MSTRKCNHTSVGMLVWQDDKLLLIERKKPPLGFAPPAGHVDEGNTYESAAKRELEEEVGLSTKELALIIEGRKENACRRPGGDWHYWKIYQVEAVGEIRRSLDETKQAGRYTREELEKLTRRTQQYLDNQIPEKQWQQNPGLEPVWLEWLQELRVI